MTKNKKNIRLPEEVENQLKICIQDLINDATLYDLGQFRSIKRSSAVLRMLFYNQGANISLVNQHGSINKLKFTSFSNKVNADSGYSLGPILATRFNVSPLAVAKYYDTFLFFSDYERPKQVTFDRWWYGVIFKLGDTEFTREGLVKIIANKDGGAHFDPTVPVTYSDLAKGFTGFKMSGANNNHLLLGGIPSDEDVIFVDVHLALLRMIVHETIISLSKELSLSIDYKPDFSKNINSSLNNVHFKLDIVK